MNGLLSSAFSFLSSPAYRKAAGLLSLVLFCQTVCPRASHRTHSVCESAMLKRMRPELTDRQVFSADSPQYQS